MADLKDIGGGFKVVDNSDDKPGTNSALDQVQKTLGLVDLANRIQAAPVEQAIKQAELRLKTNDIDNLWVRNETARAQLLAQNYEIVQKRNQMFLQNMNALPGAFAVNPAFGNAVLEQIMPGSKADVKDGVVSVVGRLPDGSLRPFSFATNTVTDPEKRQAIAQNWRKDWTQITDGFVISDENLQAIEKATPLNNGAADISIIFAYAKILDPKSVVRDGEREILVKTQSIPDDLWNSYQRATRTGGPVFTPEARQHILTAASQRVGIMRDNAITFAKGVAPILGNIDTREVFIPRGRLTHDTIFGSSGTNLTENKPPPPPGGPVTPASGNGSNQRPTPQEASVIPVGGQQQNSTPRAPRPTLDDILRNSFQNHLGGNRAKPR